MKCRIMFFFGVLGFLHASLAAEPSSFSTAGVTLSLSNDLKTLRWLRWPALETNTLSVGQEVGSLSAVPWREIGSDSLTYTWGTSNSFDHQFFSIQQAQMSSNALLTANVLNRLAYGPTPDELERILVGRGGIGPQAYIDEQLNMESFPQEAIDEYTLVVTNSAPGGILPEKTNWNTVSVSGTATSSRMYIYLTAPGEAHIDNVGLYAGTGDNIDFTTNYVRNGGFEEPLDGIWTVSANHAASRISSTVACEGAGSLWAIASSGGTTQGSSIWQTLAPGLEVGTACTLRYSYLPTTNSSLITLRLSGSGVVLSPTNELSSIEPPGWVYVTQTGTSTSNQKRMYMYLDGAGSVLIDDIKLVAGPVAEAGPNLLINGDFETPLGPEWEVMPVAADSHITTEVAHSGNGCLNLIFSDNGTTFASSVAQQNLPFTVGDTYTFSYWYVPSPQRKLTLRISGSGIVSEPDESTGSVYRRFTTGREGASLADLRSWFISHAVGSRNQLLEVLTQFLENHFVTQHDKTRDFLDTYYNDGGLIDRLAAEIEFREITRWRRALLKPDCTFHELLTISAESPAMIIYLDTVDSRGDGNNIPNENYSRELFELFANGVDNGYNQQDIVECSKAWTGWRVEIVDEADLHNPFAAQSTTVRVPGSQSRSNKVGVWTFNYQSNRHFSGPKTIFEGKTVASRFGAPWAGRNYELALPPRGGTAGIQDGYDVIAHVADLPYTQEFISVKLCRLFIHDDFVHGVYDYSNEAGLSPEGRLIKQCMLAWENGQPKGQIRDVLRVIFDSDLFRGHAGSMQKVKTPLEFVVSLVRALRADKGDGTFTASTDGYSISGNSRTATSAPLTRMGSMMLFDRADPDGYPESSGPWISAGTLAERMRYVQAALLPPNDNQRNDGISGGNNTHTDPVALLKMKLPLGLYSDADAVAGFFVSIIFPGEGLANLEQYRQLAARHLNTDDIGHSFSFFSGLDHTSPAYDTRVRSMVAMLFTLQRFQEQ